MDPRKFDLHTAIFCYFKVGLDKETCYKHLVEYLGDSAPPCRLVFYLFAEFESTKISVRNERKKLINNHPYPKYVTAMTDQNIAIIQNFVKEDPLVTFAEIEATLRIGLTAVKSIINNRLKLIKRYNCWVPEQLTPDQKKERVDWCCNMLLKFNEGRSKDVFNIVTDDEIFIYCFEPDEKHRNSEWYFEKINETSEVVHERRSCGKFMIASYFTKDGLITTIPLQDQIIATPEWYTEKCLTEVFKLLSSKYPESSIKQLYLHYDSTKPYTTTKSYQSWLENRVQTLPHPSHSPDLAPCHFALFTKVKEKLQQRSFKTSEDVLKVYNEEMSNISKEEWNEIFEEWFLRMKKCVETQGEYT